MKEGKKIIYGSNLRRLSIKLLCYESIVLSVMWILTENIFFVQNIPKVVTFVNASSKF